MSEYLMAGGIVLDCEMRRFKLRGGHVWHQLTPHPARLLAQLMRRPGRVVSRGALHAALYGDDPNGGPDPSNLNGFVFTIRRAIAAAGGTDPIRAVWGDGYWIEADPEPGVQLKLTLSERRALDTVLAAAARIAPRAAAIVRSALA